MFRKFKLTASNFLTNFCNKLSHVTIISARDVLKMQALRHNSEVERQTIAPNSNQKYHICPLQGFVIPRSLVDQNLAIAHFSFAPTIKLDNCRILAAIALFSGRWRGAIATHLPKLIKEANYVLYFWEC